MALPIIDYPTFTTILPSTGKEISFRPYRVKEEKILLTAAESTDTKILMRALLNVIGNCIEGDFDVNNLTAFDIDWMWVQLTIQSVSNVAKVIMEIDGKERKLELNLDDVKVEQPEIVIDPKIMINKDVGIILTRPTIQDLVRIEGTKKDQLGVALKSAIKQVFSGDEVFNPKDYTDKEYTDFIDSLPHAVMEHYTKFIDNVPKVVLRRDIDGKEYVFEGIKDFFQ